MSTIREAHTALALAVMAEKPSNILIIRGADVGDAICRRDHLQRLADAFALYVNAAVDDFNDSVRTALHIDADGDFKVRFNEAFDDTIAGPLTQAAEKLMQEAEEDASPERYRNPLAPRVM